MQIVSSQAPANRGILEEQGIQFIEHIPLWPKMAQFSSFQFGFTQFRFHVSSIVTMKCIALDIDATGTDAPDDML